MSIIVICAFVVSLFLLVLSREQIGFSVYLKLSLDSLAVFLIGIQGPTPSQALKFGSLFIVFLSLILTVLIFSSPQDRGHREPGS